MNEKEWIARAKRGDADAFEQLVLLHQTNVHNLCIRMVKNREDAMDLAQEAFLRAWRSLDSFRGESSFSTWLYRLTRNICLDFLRKNKNVSELPLSAHDADGEDYDLPIESPAPTPEQTALQKEKQALLLAAMEKLSAEHREILYYRVIRDLPYEQIAQILNVSLGTVKSRLCRARISLKDILAQGNYFEEISSKSSETEAVKR